MILHCSYRFWQFQFTLSSYGERQRSIICFEVSWRFQFSLPAWRAIFVRIRHTSTRRNFNSRSFHGERWKRWWLWKHVMNFNSCSPHGEQSVFILDSTIPYIISILASLRGKRSRQALFCCRNPRNFNSRPRVGSDFWGYQSGYTNLFFNSRSSREERCYIPKVVHGLLAISILAPCVGSDSARWSSRCSPRYFNSRFRVGSDVYSWQDCFA